ncbi:MAG TPA: TM2 domain-containing protein [Gemmataceae bacterium]|nr:TM2 domain-containing protein [Gemmataceae bacterium]
MSSSSNPESKRILAGILAIVVGGFGVHKFVLGMTTPGIIMLLLACTGVSGIIGLIEGIIYLTKSDEEFIRLYQSENPKQWF